MHPVRAFIIYATTIKDNMSVEQASCLSKDARRRMFLISWPTESLQVALGLL